jgi:hypothetical protein
MAQLNVFANYPGRIAVSCAITNGGLSFCPMNLANSIQWSIIHFCPAFSIITSVSLTVSIGLYYLTGGTLTMTNSVSGTFSTTNAQRGYISMTATSAGQNIGPGTWYLGYLISTSGTSGVSILGMSSLGPAAFSPGNASPGFYCGTSTATATALPQSVATTDLDVTGSDSFPVPYILLTT